MATHAFDLATILKIFTTLKEEKRIGEEGWVTNNASQAEVIDLFEKYAEKIKFLEDIHCEIKFESALTLVATATLDKQVRWIDGIAKEDEIVARHVSYPAFRLKAGCVVFQVKGFAQPLLVIKTKNGDTFWILMQEKEIEGIELVRMAFSVLSALKKRHPEYVRYPSAIIPKVDFNLEPDIHFLEGAYARKGFENWSIIKATQKFKFRMNEEGARAVVKTAMMFFGCCAQEVTKKEVIKINKPFVGWFTQHGSDFPMAVFYADVDSWKETGSLSDL